MNGVDYKASEFTYRTWTSSATSNTDLLGKGYFKLAFGSDVGELMVDGSDTDGDGVKDTFTATAGLNISLDIAGDGFELAAYDYNIAGLLIAATINPIFTG